MLREKLGRQLVW